MALPRRGYIPVFFDWPEKTEPLTDAEKGRLMDAMIAYACDGELVEMTGNERIAFPFFRERIDDARKAYDNKVKAGSSRTEQNRTEESRKEQKRAEASRSEQKGAEENKEEQKETERKKKGNNNINNNNKESEVIIIIFNALKDCLGREITEAEKKLLEEWVSKYGAGMVSEKIEAMTLYAKDKTLSYLKTSLENEANGVKKGKHGPETLEEKEKRERAEEIEKWVWNQQIYADLRTNKESEAWP